MPPFEVNGGAAIGQNGRQLVARWQPDCFRLPLIESSVFEGSGSLSGIMMKHGTASIGVRVLAALFLLGCSDQQSAEAPGQVVGSEISRFTTLDLKVGMNREQVEEQVAALLETRSTYSTYGSNLIGGTVRYGDGDWILEVEYKAGAPAPWIIGEDGKAQHHPPVDESVLAFKIEKYPAKSDSAESL